MLTEVSQIGSRGLLFRFNDLDGFEGLKELSTLIYLIKGKQRTYLIDTFLGPETMEPITAILEDVCGISAPKIIVNTHYHWDHVWGNCSFADSLIIGHLNSVKLWDLYSASELSNYSQYCQGKVRLVKPELLFSERLLFEDDGLEIFWTPGHTLDSISVFDRVDRVLITGDNIELPVPLISNSNLNDYIRSLYHYLEIKPEYFISSHSGVVNSSVVHQNINYLETLNLAGDLTKWETEPGHKMNLAVLEK